VTHVTRDAGLFLIGARQVRGREVHLAGRHLERLAGIFFVADVKLKILAAAGAAHDDMMRPERRTQGDADQREPRAAVLDHQGAVSVGLDIRNGTAGRFQRQEFDSSRHGTLVRQIGALGESASRHQYGECCSELQCHDGFSTLARRRPRASRASM
jgi:hypothetical protein